MTLADTGSSGLLQAELLSWNLQSKRSANQTYFVSEDSDDFEDEDEFDDDDDDINDGVDNACLHIWCPYCYKFKNSKYPKYENPKVQK